MTLGLKDLYYAVYTEAEGAETYGAPKKMAEAMEADLSVKTETVSYTHLDVYKRQAFMSIELDDLQAMIEKEGWTSEYQNGQNQWGTKMCIRDRGYSTRED